MIRYGCSEKAIISEIINIDPSWLQKARERTNTFRKLKKFQDKSPIWGIVKPIFVRHQSEKCVFCERQFHSDDIGTIEYDLEHFRPKSSVKRWPPKGVKHSFDFKLGNHSKSGYYWLAYDVRNYAASCKVCNSPLKGCYFPVAGRRITRPGRVSSLRSEKAFLCYPLGKTGDDPEKIITFVGTMAVPAKKSGQAHKRAQVIIEFFKLNSLEQLHRERARMIILISSLLTSGGAGRLKLNDTLQSGDLPHTNCLRSFARLWDADRATAREILEACKAVAMSWSKPGMI